MEPLSPSTLRVDSVCGFSDFTGDAVHGEKLRDEPFLPPQLPEPPLGRADFLLQTVHHCGRLKKKKKKFENSQEKVGGWGVGVGGLGGRSAAGSPFQKVCVVEAS